MQHPRSVRRAVLLALTLLSACGASDPAPGVRRSTEYEPTGALGNFLAGQFAMSAGDPATAAQDFLKALATDPGNKDLLTQAFMASVSAGRPEAVRLARQLPDNQVAQLIITNDDMKAGRWQAAEKRLHGLPRQGLTQLLQPLMLAWVQQGDGRTDAALTTLRPYVESPRLRGIFALHAAMIADVANRTQEAGRLYDIAQAEMPELTLRLAQILASWQARNGNAAGARAILSDMSAGALDSSLALQGLTAAVAKRAVTRATDGGAEAYIALAAALRAQGANDFAGVMVRLALDLRPDFAAGRLLQSDIETVRNRPATALLALNGIPDDNPLAALIRLRRVSLQERLGHTDEALRDLNKLIRDYPSSPVPEIQLGDMMRLKQRFPEAIDAYSRAIALMPSPARTDWPVFYNRGVSYERSGQWPKAEADFDRALELAPDQPSVLNYLGYSWADMGRHLDRALEMIQRAAARRPNDGAIVDSLGWVMFKQGDLARAVSTLERAVELEPEDATINGHLGDAYWAIGRKIEAQYQWRRALTLNPSADETAKLEAKLNTGGTGSVAIGQ